MLALSLSWGSESDDIALSKRRGKAFICANSAYLECKSVLSQVHDMSVGRVRSWVAISLERREAYQTLQPCYYICKDPSCNLTNIPPECFQELGAVEESFVTSYRSFGLSPSHRTASTDL